MILWKLEGTHKDRVQFHTGLPKNQNPKISQQHHHGSIISPWVVSLFSLPTQLHRYFPYIPNRSLHPLYPILQNSCNLLQNYIREIPNMGGHLYHQDNWPPISNCDTGFSVVTHSSVTLHMNFNEKETQTISKHESA